MISKYDDVLIIGAGIAGLMAARRLRRARVSVRVVEKGEMVGGRLATRPMGEGWADLGAQFFTVRSPTFQAIVDEWLAHNVVFEWSRGWSDGSLLGEGMADGFPRYAGRAGMAGIANWLAQDVEIALGVEMRALTAVSPTLWQATDSHNRTYHSRAVLLTPPVPQSLALLANGSTSLHADDKAALDQISYAPCLCGLFWVDGAVHLPEPGALQRPNHRFSWLADNQRKGLSPTTTLITVHASPAASRELWQTAVSDTLTLMQTALVQFLAEGATIRQAQLTKWPYALPETVHPAPFLLAQGTPALIFAGDAFNGPRVEGAALSGLAAAEQLLASWRTPGK